ncbi:hypothetical protein FDX20_02580, partial [Citrobacter sp. TBCS-11]
VHSSRQANGYTSSRDNRPAIYDTLYFGFFLDSEKEIQANVFQAEWEKGRPALMDNVYYRVEGNKVY